MSDNFNKGRSDKADGKDDAPNSGIAGSILKVFSEDAKQEDADYEAGQKYQQAVIDGMNGEHNSPNYGIVADFSSDARKENDDYEKGFEEGVNNRK